MISARIGLSEAGKRINSAGIAFELSKKDFPDPKLVAAVQAALDGAMVVSAPTVEAAVPSCRDIASQVAAEHGLTLSDIISRSRARSLMMARFEAYYRCITGTLSTVADVGRRLGDRDHATILNGIARYCAEQGLPMPRGLSERVRK